MIVPIYQVDAFTEKLFGGNPAAVCLLERWIPESLMQAIAAENNLSETAFLVPEGDWYGLRWFTPAAEVDLCGHATLASAYVLFRFVDRQASQLRFRTRSGELLVQREGELLAMDLPSRPPQPVAPPVGLSEALGEQPEQVLASRDLMVVFSSEDQVCRLAPRMELLRQIPWFAVIVTAASREVDFVSRFFAPRVGVDEDPVTGSAHCTLVPYWAGRLGKKHLVARQLSTRGGQLWCEDRGERVVIKGKCVLYMEGRLYL